MKSISLFSQLLTVIALLFMLGACETDVPEGCVQPEFNVSVSGDSSDITITANFDGIENISYSWYVNDVLVETEELDEDRNNEFDVDLSPGTYKICIRAELSGCDEVVEFCQEVTIEGREDSDCPELSFEKERIWHGKYLFTANFEGRDSIFYTWYVNGDSIESESLDGERFHKFDYQFDVGEHKVCIIAETDSCGVLEFCKEIEIEEEDECTEIKIEAESDGTSAYLFTTYAEHGERDSIQYKWYIDGEFVDKENFEGHETDHQLYWQFEPGEHAVCIETVATDRCEAYEYCKEIFIEGETAGCPDLHFEYEIRDNNEYKFFADFEGIEHLEWYGWYVNGDLVEEEGVNNGGDNFLVKSLVPGEYEVCIKTETESCPEGTAFCEVIVVEEEETPDCVDLSYTASQTDGGYLFTADFDARDSVTYIWKVFINDDFQGEEVREAGSDDDHEFFWQFEPGVTYEVCLKQDGCAENAVCENFTLTD